VGELVAEVETDKAAFELTAPGGAEGSRDLVVPGFAPRPQACVPVLFLLLAFLPFLAFLAV